MKQKKKKRRVYQGETEPVIFNGVVIGMATQGHFVDSDAPFGPCMGVGCDRVASNDTLTGLELCDRCFGRFYSDDADFHVDPSNGRDVQGKEPS